MQQPITNKNLEVKLNIEDDGIMIEVYKKQQDNILTKIVLDDSPGFKLLKKVLDDLEFFNDGSILYTGDKNINEVTKVFISLGFSVEIQMQCMKTTEQKITSLKKKECRAVDDEDYILAAKIRDEIRELSK